MAAARVPQRHLRPLSLARDTRRPNGLRGKKSSTGRAYEHIQRDRWTYQSPSASINFADRASHPSGKRGLFCPRKCGEPIGEEDTASGLHHFKQGHIAWRLHPVQPPRPKQGLTLQSCHASPGCSEMVVKSNPDSPAAHLLILVYLVVNSYLRSYAGNLDYGIRCPGARLVCGTASSKADGIQSWCTATSSLQCRARALKP